MRTCAWCVLAVAAGAAFGVAVAVVVLIFGPDVNASF